MNIHTKKKDQQRALDGHTAPKSHPYTVLLQPINGLNVLDLPHPVKGGLVLVEMLFAGCRAR